MDIMDEISWSPQISEIMKEMEKEFIMISDNSSSDFKMLKESETEKEK